MRAKAVQAFSKLIRLDNSLFGAFAVLLSGLYAGDLRGFQFEYLVAFLIVFLMPLDPSQSMITVILRSTKKIADMTGP